MGDRGCTGRSREEGGLLIILMIGVAISSIALTAATQAWSVTLRRDKEDELIFRGEQYVTAILAYRKEHGGQFPTNLQDLYKPGPRGVRYLRKLYKDPIKKDGRWGLLYLMPGGQSVYDPGAAQRAQKAQEGLSGWDDAVEGGTVTPGVTSINRDPTGSGVPTARGSIPGAPAGMMPLPPLAAATGGFDNSDEDAVSEPPLGWPIVGVISRASGKLAENTFRVYKGHTSIDEWQFNVFDRGLQLQAQPNAAQQQGQAGQRFVGPGFGGRGSISGISDGRALHRRPQGRMDRGMNVFPAGPGSKTPPGGKPVP
jgi:type II secretory pathway pseudopilin PulG